MKKINLWYVAIFSGAIFCTTLLVLTVMYAQNLASYAGGGMTKLKSFKNKAMHPFANKNDFIAEE